MSVLDEFTRKKKAAALLTLINIKSLNNELLRPSIASYRYFFVLFQIVIP